MRFESVHQYFKDVVRRVRNFKNLTKTLSFQFQCKQACSFSSTSLLGESHVVEAGKGKTKSICEYNNDLREFCVQFRII